MKLISVILCIFLITPFFSSANEDFWEKLMCLNQEEYGLKRRALHLTLNNPRANEDFLAMKAKLKSLDKKRKKLLGTPSAPFVELIQILEERNCLLRDFIRRFSSSPNEKFFYRWCYVCRAQLLD